MGLFSAISEWSNGRYEKKVAKMRELGKCPDCNGHGIEVMPYEHFFSSPYECPSCAGTGQFSDWMK
ncbi:methionine aminopeptidase [Aquibacillus sediminis]|uniref:methionine aminopeptidase n=1 Tax=Aquibacillus sediminis TaxID=2574734 RepID=UPI0011087F0D|nr:methionine aminopeptidase [Aquibacillus sediminis]